MMRSKWLWIRRYSDLLALAAFVGLILVIAFRPTIAGRFGTLVAQFRALVAGLFAAVFVLSTSIVLLNMIWPPRLRFDDSRARCRRCGYDLRASRDLCPE